MRLNFGWLKELADFDWDPEELTDRLSLSGTESSIVGPLFPEFTGAIVGKVVTCEDHPSSDKLKVCEVDTGSNTLTTVCGAPNVHAGLKVAFAGPGSELPNGITIAAIEKLGVKSEGMICSESELGLSEDHSVIMELDRELKPGTSLREALELDDWLLDFELTPNRPDCLSALGIAREIAALNGTKVNMPKFELEEVDQDAANEIKIKIDSPELCPRYMARVIRDVAVGSSPWWIKKKLYAAGLRSINNIVDITNLVLMEYGHPLHAFDLDNLSKPKIVVRRARQNEKFTTLDEVERTLNNDMVVITDSVLPVAIGGIMGGLDSEVTGSTENLLLESAYFDPKTILRGGKALDLTSESQIRFEKGADPNNVPAACDRAAFLMGKYAGGKVLSGQVDCYPKVIEPVKIKLRPARVNSILDTDLAAPKMIDILSALQFGVRTGKRLEVTVPTFRPDVTREIDLIEEIARIYGLDRIKTSTAPGGVLITKEREEDKFHRTLRTLLTSLGCIEALTNTLIDPVKDKEIGDLEGHVEVIHPVSAELSVLRKNLVQSFLNIVAYNYNRRKTDITFFEIGKVFIPTNEDLPHERQSLGLVFCGREDNVHWLSQPTEYSFFDLKGILEVLGTELRLGDLGLIPNECSFFDHDVSFDVLYGEDVCGVCGQISKRSAEPFDLDIPVFFAEIDLDKILSRFSPEQIFKAIPKFPSAMRDIALVVDRNVLSQDLKAEILSAGGELIARVELFDVYEGKQIPGNKKSLAFAIEYRSESKTLTDEEVDNVHHRIVTRLGEKFSAELRM